MITLNKTILGKYANIYDRKLLKIQFRLKENIIPHIYTYIRNIYDNGYYQ
jgi:hypothetical protein